MIEAIVIGGSAGGIEALSRILPHLPLGFRPPIIIVVHVPEHPNLLSEVFRHKIKLQIKEADEKENILSGNIYLAPPGYHLLIEKDKTFSLSTEDPVHYSRPSIDVLFESAADCYRNKLMAILLTGANEDGAQGLRAVQAAGGLTVIQDPHEARMAKMPESGRPFVKPEHILTIDKIISLLLESEKTDHP